MFRTRSSLRGLLGLGAAALLAGSGLVQAQMQIPQTQLGSPLYTTGSRYAVGPAIAPAGYYYPGTGYSLINRGYYGVSPYEAFPNSNSNPYGIYMTVLNYPGVYGQYSYGITPEAFAHRTAPEMWRYVPRETTAATAGAALSSATVDVYLPADAELWFNNSQSQQRGSKRYFETPVLRPGQDYNYEVRASWPEGARTVTRTRRLLVHAGDHLTVEFRRNEEPPTIMEYPSTGSGR